MTRRTLAISFAALAALLAIAIVLLLPPPAARSAPSSMTRTSPVVRGAYHVHSQRSDGTGTLDEIAAAAARAGLQFVIITDHGDGTRPPEPPAYRSGVLCVDGVEISTDDGHYVAIDLPQSPYPIRGDARAVIEDVRRFGGFGIAAHPASPKPELQWQDWDARFDGIEWLNADSEWRDEFWGSLGALLLTYPIRPVETLAAVLDRPTDVLSRWYRLALQRRVPALAGADAHARLGFRQATDPYEDRVIARVPSYETSFRAFVNHVMIARPLSGDARLDAQLITSAIREGHSFTSIDGLAGLGAFEARATSGNAIAVPGGYLEVTTPVEIHAAIAAPPGTTLAVLRGSEVLYETRDASLRIDVGTDPGAYHIEARLASQRVGSAVPWVLTNPIYVGLQGAHAAAAAESRTTATTRTAVATEAWTAEASDGSTSALRSTALEDGTPALEWQFSLAAGARGSQYAAIRFPLANGLGAHDRLQLRGRSDRPRRLWAQLRTSGAAGGQRWGRTFYVDSDLEQIELRFEDFRPFDAASAARPPLDQIESVLLVVDTVNTVPGSAGRIAFTDLWFAR